MEVCTHEKAVFFLPVNILMVWSLAFLAARHTTVCLDMYCIVPSFIKLFLMLSQSHTHMQDSIHYKVCILKGIW